MFKHAQERLVTEDMREKHIPASDRQGQAKPGRMLAAQSAGKDRLAAALRENLKRRKVQVSGRRQVSARQDESAPEQAMSTSRPLATEE